MDTPLASISVWNWLPAFRAVAATEHLPTASKRLGVSPSALSRTVRQLEEGVGRPLFHRRGRLLVLNADGRLLYERVVEAFTQVEVGLERLDAGRTSGPLRTGTSGSLAQAVLGAGLQAIVETHPGLLPYVHEHEAAAAGELLRAGRLDIWVGPVVPAGQGLIVTSLGEVSVGVYAGRDHPLHDVETPSEQEIACQPFVALVAPDGPTNVAGAWRVEALVHQAHVALHLCALGRLLAVFEEPVARPYAAFGVLRRLPGPVLPPAPLFLARAQATMVPARIAVIERVLRAQLRPVTGSSLAVTSRVPPVVTPAPRSGWLSTGDTLVAHGEYEGARRTYQQALRERLDEGPPLTASERGRHAARLAFIDVRVGAYAEAVRVCSAALDELRASTASGAAVAALSAVAALACCFGGDLTSAERWLAQAVGGLEDREGHDPTARVEARVRVARAEGNIRLASGRPLAALAAYERGVEACRDAGDDWEHSIALYNLAEASLQVGDVPRATELLEQAERAKRALDDRWGLAYVHWLRAQLALGRGQPDDALTQLRSALALAVGRIDPQLGAMLSLSLGQARLMVGDLAGAAHAFSLVETSPSPPVARDWVVRATLGQALVHLRQGDTAAARQRAEHAHSLAAGLGAGRRTEIEAVLGEVCLAEGNSPGAARYFRTALEHAWPDRLAPFGWVSTAP